MIILSFSIKVRWKNEKFKRKGKTYFMIIYNHKIVEIIGIIRDCKVHSHHKIDNFYNILKLRILCYSLFIAFIGDKSLPYFL